VIVGIPKEVKNHEYRVAATPEGVRELVHAGHRVVVEASAGEGSAIADEQYTAAGAEILPDADAVFEAA
jgi:alanine dehydrogenase